mgnify:CR=1 FL=1
MNPNKCYNCNKGSRLTGGFCKECRIERVYKTHRVCNVCKTMKELNITNFNAGHRKNGGFSHYCRQCSRTRKYDRYKNVLKVKDCPICKAKIVITSEYCRNCRLTIIQKNTRNPGWRGGRIKAHGGYINVIVPSNYQYILPDNKRYILEHRLVMEQCIGRALLPTENVHHKNGNRLDNRLENLELWNKSQPSGQRVEDKVRFAIEILKLYRPDILSL